MMHLPISAVQMYVLWFKRDKNNDDVEFLVRLP